MERPTSTARLQVTRHLDRRRSGSSVEFTLRAFWGLVPVKGMIHQFGLTCPWRWAPVGTQLGRGTGTSFASAGAQRSLHASMSAAPSLCRPRLSPPRTLAGTPACAQLTFFADVNHPDRPAG